MMKKLKDYFVQRDRGWMLALLFAAGIVYLPFMASPFVFDDKPFFVNEVIGHYSDTWFRFEVRWFAYAALAWIYNVFSDVHTHPYHVMSMLLHGFNGILLFYLIRDLFSLSGVSQHKSPELIQGAWLAALLFVCHPVAVYAVGYAVELSIVMSTTFALLMQLAYFRALSRGQAGWMVLTILAYFLSVFSKEHSVMMPAILLAETFLLRGNIRLSRTRMWGGWAGLVAVAILITLTAKGVIGTPYEPMSAQLFERKGLDVSPMMLHVLSAMSQAGLFFKYLLLWLLPHPDWMAVDMREEFSTAWASWQAILGSVAFVVYGGMAIRLLWQGGRAGLVGLALIYPWLLFITEFSSIRIQEIFVLYRSYLWMPGLLLVVPLLVMLMPGKRTWLLLLGVAVLQIGLARTVLMQFSSDFRMWDHAVSLLPNDKVLGADRVYYNRGESLALERRWFEAAQDFEHAVALSPDYPQLHKELGVAYANLQRYPEAIAQFDSAIKLDAKFAVAYYYKGLSLKRMGQHEAAMQQMEKSCKLEYVMACVIFASRGMQFKGGK